jgi:hypothetical protein
MTKRTGTELSITALLSFLISLIALEPAIRRVTSAWGAGDMLATYVNVDNWGWFEYTANNHYGYPFGINTNLFPNIDITQNVIAKLLTLITGSPFAGINLLLVLSFPIIGALAYVSIRLTGLKGPLAVTLATAFTMIPFHFGRGLGHTYLAVFYGAVTAVILAQLIGTGRLARMLNPQSNTKKTFIFNIFAVVLLVVSTAWSGVYYAAFGLILMSTAWLWQLSRSRVRQQLLLNTIPILAVGILAVIGFIPALIALSADPPYASLGERTPFESVIFAGNLAMAILAAPMSRLALLAGYNINISGAFAAAPALENTALTNYGTWITFAAVLFTVWALFTKFRNQLTFLLTLTAVTVLFFVPWGLNYFFAAFISPQIRAWNRLIPILLLLFILMAATVAARISTPVWIAVSLAVVILLITAVESVWPFRAIYAQNAVNGTEITQAAQSYVQQIDAALPENCAILQLPYMVYPENAPSLQINDYDHFWTSLTGTNKSWSYGAVKQTQASAWMSAQPEIPSLDHMSTLAQAGFCGIHLDTRGYVKPAAERIVESLTERYGAPAATQRTSNASLTDDWLFFITDSTAKVTTPADWSPELTAFLNRPAITTGSPGLIAENMTVAPRGSKDGLIWWWTIAPEATFTIHPVSNSAPLTSISGGIRIPQCAANDTENLTLTLSTGETLIVEANKKTTTNFTLELKTPAPIDTNTVMTVMSPVEGCQPADFGYPQFAQVIDLVTNP